MKQTFYSTLFILFFCSIIEAQNCPAGQYWDGSKCIVCPKGSYCPGNDTKILCATGTVAPITGQTHCDNCVAGKYQDQVGQETCKDCLVGTYQNAQGADGCINCAAGRYQDQPGQITCKDCPTGTYQNAQGAIGCTNCQTGTYQDQMGQANCINCAVGRYQNQTGQTACKDCEKGTYQNAQGADGCINCAAGTYQDVVGQIMCKNCPVGTYQSAQGTVGCINCPAGKTTSGEGATICDVTIPVEMVSFDAETNGRVVFLRWITAQEINTSFYVVQKSRDVKDWTTIARTNGKGTYSKTSVYDIIDPFPEKGITYYRIKEVDFDGKETFSKIVSVAINEKTALKVYPNPVTHQLTVAHADEAIRSVAIYNVVGQMVMNFTFTKTNIGSMDLSNLMKGQYLLRVYTEGGAYTYRIMKAE